MIAYPEWISPNVVSFSLPSGGEFAIRWYSVMYLVGYILGFFIFRKRVREGLFRISEEALDSFISHLIIGMLIGARVFYVLFYNFNEYASDPTQIFAIWKGGLSFHGAAVGMTVGCWLFARKNKVSFFEVTDAMALAAALGVFFGRWGNFINGELYGRPTDVAWGMIFPTDPHEMIRHPSQIYQSLTEGLLLFIILWNLQKWALKNNRYRPGLIGGSFLVGYGVFRFLVEYTREPDAQLGLLLGGFFSMGQILCFFTALAGFIVLMYTQKTQPVLVPTIKAKEAKNQKK
ncbi:MAG TPA: prolipoprotein diacylglyceryl transferase [Bdellovibrionota bacterium]|jgi:phosphatidylglycerol:prolipoprotein diacylglycerol transferase|nr:prolipoprotein diacylglyceryl transferase [Bdellovibrionota bacterium]